MAYTIYSFYSQLYFEKQKATERTRMLNLNGGDEVLKDRYSFDDYYC